MKKTVRLRRGMLPYLLILPAVIWIVFILIQPIVRVFQLSFTNTMLLRPTSYFVGFKNYRRLFSDYLFYRSTINSFIFTIFCVVFQHLVGVSLALILNRKFKGRGLVRGLLLLPWITPVIVMAFVWQWLFADLYGVFNHYLQALKLTSEPIGFLGSTTTAMASVILANVWHGFPFPMLVSLAALESIPKELYEAGRIDGASRWSLFLYITLPGIRNILLISVLLMTIWTFNNFDVVYLFTRGGPGEATYILPIFAYVTSFDSMRTAYGSTIVVQMILILIGVSVLFYKASRTTGREDLGRVTR